MKSQRLIIAALSVSAIGLVGILADEGYTDRPVIPTQGDRPTIGFGSTIREDGTPVQMTDGPITPHRAVARTLTHIQRDETRLRSCVRKPMSQVEYDVLVDFAYQYGSRAACESAMVLFVNAEMYRESCDAYLLYSKAGGYECSTMIDGQPNKRCWGVWKRSMARRDRCMAAQ